MQTGKKERLAAAVQGRKARWQGPPLFWKRDDGTVKAGARSVARGLGALADPGAAPLEERVVALDPDAGQDAVAAAERALSAAGAEVLEKHSNAFEDTLVVRASAETVEALRQLPGVRSVAPKPRLRPLAVSAVCSGGDALVFAREDSCSASDAARGATRLDVLPTDARAVLNDAAGALVIVTRRRPALGKTYVLLGGDGRRRSHLRLPRRQRRVAHLLRATRPQRRGGARRGARRFHRGARQMAGGRHGARVT